MILSSDDASIVTLGEDVLVKKLVLKEKRSGLISTASPEKLVDRETKALSLLSGVEGVIQLVLRNSEISFSSRYIEGTQLKRYTDSLPAAYFEELVEIFRICHEKGVYRFSRSREDILVTPEQRPVLVDFGNVLFRDDAIARIPCLIKLAEVHNISRTNQLKRLYDARHP